MHPILFHIPLPNRPLKIWWALVALAALSAVYALWAQRRAARQDAIVGLIVAAAAGAAAYYWRGAEYRADNVPIFSYGVMLGLSLVVGWYITLPLAKRTGLPVETMANCYVWTALAALAGSRVLYILTNLDEFHTTADYFALRKGGLVAYGGFIGGYLGSWVFLARHRIRLMPWGDVAAPSIAAGLFITRIGCYLYGCDFGMRLSDSAPALLKKAGTFPKLAEGTLGYFENGVSIPGSPAFAHHADLCARGIYKAADCVALKDASFPVHPTQLYESAIGLGLLALLLWQRKVQKFRGQLFLTFVFGYGFLRFLIELLRDDAERGSLPFHSDRYVLVSFGLLAMGAAFVYGFAKAISAPQLRMGATVLAFVPGVAAFVILKTGQFEVDDYAYSTSQFIGLVSAVLAAVAFSKLWDDARRSPRLAMALGLEGAALAGEPAEAPARNKRSGDDEADDAEGAPEQKKRSGKKRAKKPEAVAAETASEETAPEPASGAEGDEDDEAAP
jgi:phosphatidylglycerol:prolipoprotein diacylglycerol transferase